MDIYKPYINKNAGDRELVRMGRISATVALVIGAIMAPLLGGIDQAFQFIQEYTGVVSPGILAVFMLGLFWKKSTNKAAIIGVITSIPVAMYFKIGPKNWIDSSFFVDLPFLHQMGYTVLITMAIIAVVSFVQNRGEVDEKGIQINTATFKTSPIFNAGSFAVILILVALYAFFWS